MIRWLTTPVWLMIWTTGLLASDRQRELDFAQFIQSEVTDGKSVWLQAETEKFLAIDTDSEAREPLGTALLLHDMGDHPDQRPLIHALRTGLPQHRWHTLSLQMPLRESEASIEEYYALLGEAESRVQAALNYLIQKDPKAIVIIGYGLGAQTALLSSGKQPEKFAGLVTFSLAVAETGQQSESLQTSIRNLKMPFLDIYAEFDQPEVLGSARNRRLLAKDNNQYRQLKLDGDDHSYQTDADLTVKRVYSWLSTLEPPKH